MPPLDTGGRGQDIQIAVQQGKTLAEGPVVFGPIPEVCTDSLAVAALGPKLGGGIMDLLRRADDDHPATGFGQCLGHTVAKALGAAGDDGLASFNVKQWMHRCPSLNAAK